MIFTNLVLDRGQPRPREDDLVLDRGQVLNGFERPGMIPSYVSCTSGPFRILVLTADQIYRLKVDFYQPRPRSRTTLSSRGRPRPRSRTSRPLQTRSTQKQRITNYRFVKLDYHAEPNHPAKYDGPGIHSLKVRFYRHNGMSLIFKQRREKSPNFCQLRCFTAVREPLPPPPRHRLRHCSRS